MAIIMIVDDSNLTIKIIKEFLTELCPIEEDLDILTAKDGQEALSLFKIKKPDIVFMDITMPHLDGISCMHEMRNIDSEIRVVMVTSHAEEKIMNKAMIEGAIDYLLKPLRKEEFQRVLEQQLGW